VKGSQIIEGGTTNIQTRDLVLEDRTIELGVAVADANTVVHLSNIAPVGDFSVATDLSTLSQDLASAVKFPGAGADAWPWFRPYDVATSVAGNAYVAALVDVSVDVDAHYTGREIYSRSDGFQDFANGIIYDPIVSHYKYMKSFPVAGGNIIILKTSGSTLQPSGANVEVYSNAFLYGINGDYETQEWPMDSSVGVFSADAPEIAPKLYSDGISNEAGLIVRANKTESLQWYKSSGQQTSPYWRLTSDVFIGETNLFHFADKGNESSSHWFFSIDEASGSMQLCYGTRASYLLSASWDKPLAI